MRRPLMGTRVAVVEDSAIPCGVDTTTRPARTIQSYPVEGRNAYIKKEIDEDISGSTSDEPAGRSMEGYHHAGHSSLQAGLSGCLSILL
jgi:hypothetical protein